jgi:hypothetical protein
METSGQQKVPTSLAGELPPGGSYSPGCHYFFSFLFVIFILSLSFLKYFFYLYLYFSF